MSKVTILHFITELGVGGAQSALLNLVTGCDHDRFSPAVICLFNGEGINSKTLGKESIPVEDAKMVSKFRLDSFLKVFYKFKQYEPAILHTWMFHANIPGRVLGRIAKIPIIVSSERNMGLEGRWRLNLNKYTSELSDRVICVSDNVGQFAIDEIGIDERKIYVVPNGINLGNYSNPISREDALDRLGFPRQSTVVGVIARLQPQKGLRFLIEACSAIVLSHPQARLLIIGSGPEKKDLENQANITGVGSHIHFMGYRRDVNQLLPALNVFTLPSLYEGMPNAVLEAMAAGKPVVATKVGGVPEIVIDGETGILVPPKDPVALAKAIDTLLSNPDLARRMGEAGRKRAIEHFDIRLTIKKTEALYDHLLKEKLGLVYQEGVGWVKTL